MPPDIAAEAAALRREQEARQRQLMHERLFGHSSSSALSAILRSPAFTSRLGSNRGVQYTRLAVQRGGTFQMGGTNHRYEKYPSNIFCWVIDAMTLHLTEKMVVFFQTIWFQCRLSATFTWSIAIGPWGFVLPASSVVCGWAKAQYQPFAPCAQKPLLPLPNTRVGHPQSVIHPSTQQWEWSVCRNPTFRRLTRQKE